MASKPIKQKANLGASYNLRVRRIPSLAEYCFIAQAERLDQLSHRRREAPWTPAEFLPASDALKRLKYFVNVQLRNRTDAALS
ncbi:MAG TPA: hypothetical protein VGW99_05000, partial [Chthoniobacterales bacterium]|nr:hypothetical protein [Chthoniobacterales bacterium]